MKQGRNNKRIVKCGISLVILCTLLVPNAPMTAWAVSSTDVTNPTEVEGQINEIGDREVTGLDTDAGDVSDSNTEIGINDTTRLDDEDAAEPSIEGIESPADSETVIDAETGAVAIDAANFPDEAFRNYILETWDKNSDNVLSEYEISIAKSIYADNLGIESIQGVEYFENLETLWIWSNKLKSVDISHNKKISSFICNLNELSTLDLSQNTDLELLSVDSNSLNNLDLSNNLKLVYLICPNNELTQINISKLTNLKGKRQIRACI